MSLWEKIKALFALNKVVNNVTEEAKKMTGTTPGYKTTEFWLNLAVQIGVLWTAIRGFIPPKEAAIIEVAGVGIYTVARTVLKVIADIKAAQTPPAS